MKEAGTATHQSLGISEWETGLKSKTALYWEKNVREYLLHKRELGRKRERLKMLKKKGQHGWMAQLIRA